MRVLVPSLLLAFVVAGCAAPQPSIAAQSGITGTALVGPTCPVERNPPDPACAPRPYVGNLTLEDAGGTTVRTFATDAHGNFKVAASPGTYSIASPQSLPRCSASGVVVVDARYTHVDVACDSGIR